jgi:hypothetical protein
MRSIRNAIIGFFIFAGLLWVGLINLQEKKEMSDLYISPSIRAECLNWQRKIEKEGIDPRSAIARISSIRVVQTDEYVGIYDRSRSEIKISSRVFERGEYSAKCAIYHELGHSVFNLEHGDCGIMNETVLSEEYLRINWERLLTEYLNRCYENRWESV